LEAPADLLHRRQHVGDPLAKADDGDPVGLHGRVPSPSCPLSSATRSSPSRVWPPISRKRAMLRLPDSVRVSCWKRKLSSDRPSASGFAAEFTDCLARRTASGGNEAM